MRFNAYDIAYCFLIGMFSPYWLIVPSARRKVLLAFRERMGSSITRNLSRPAIMIHAVSLGEMNATRALVDQLLAARPEIQIIVSTTTTTGHARGQQLYGSSKDVLLIRYPLDFTSSVDSTLNTLKPIAVVLMELELWPNFVRACDARKIPIILANGRLTLRSFNRYKLIKPIITTMLRRVTRFCVQDKTYADRFIELGAPVDRVQITGTMKFDTAEVLDVVPGADLLARELGLQIGKELIWVCGSTGPGEEELVLREYRLLVSQFSRLRLVIVPRKPERFDEVARLIEEMKFRVLRRSRNETPPVDPPIPPVILGDTMGELRKFYGIATVVFVGRSLVDLGASQHGSDMIEPAALGKPVLVGRYAGNFAEVMNKLREAEAILIADDAPSLGQAIKVLLSTPSEAKAMGKRARSVVIQQQGATERHCRVILDVIASRTLT